jgi:hypothetical protein
VRSQEREATTHGNGSGALGWLLPAAVSIAAGFLVARLASSEIEAFHEHKYDGDLAQKETQIDTHLDRSESEQDTRIDSRGIAPLILVLELLAASAGTIILAFVIPPAFYAALIVFGPLSLLGMIVIGYHFRVHRAAKQSDS